MDVVWHLLYVPGELARLEIECDDGIRVQIGARANLVVEIWRRISGGHQKKALLDIDRHGRPRRAASVLGSIPPRVGARLLAGWNDVEGPDQRPGVDVEGIDTSIDADVRAGITREDLAVERDRRAGDFIAEPRVADANVPQQLAGRGVQGDQVSIDGAPEDLATIQRDTAVVRQPFAIGRNVIVGP